MDNRNTPQSGNFNRKLKKILDGSSDSVLLLAIMLLLLLSRLILGAFPKENLTYSLAVIILLPFCFILPSVVYIYLRHYKRDGKIPDIKLHAPSLMLLPAIVISLVMLISGALLIILFGRLSDEYDFSVYSSFSPMESFDFGKTLLTIIAFAFIPSVCEEFTFRGIFCSIYGKRGILPSILLSSLYFTLSHLNAAGFFVFMYAGIILCLVTYACNSIYVGIAIHFAYNLFCLFGLPYISTYYVSAIDSRLFTFLLTLIFLVSAAAFCVCMGIIYRKRAASSRPSVDPVPKVTESLIFTAKELISFAFVVALIVYTIYSAVT